MSIPDSEKRHWMAVVDIEDQYWLLFLQFKLYWQIFHGIGFQRSKFCCQKTVWYESQLMDAFRKAQTKTPCVVYRINELTIQDAWFLNREEYRTVNKFNENCVLYSLTFFIFSDKPKMNVECKTKNIKSAHFRYFSYAIQLLF